MPHHTTTTATPPYFCTRQVPADTGFGGYDLCGDVHPDPDRKPVW